MEKIIVAALSPTIVSGDKAKNLESAHNGLRVAKARGVALAVFSEWYLTHCVDERSYAVAEPAWRAALTAGETFVLTGEDMGRFPGSTFTTQGLYDNHALETLQRLVRSAQRVSVPRDWPSTLICRIGKGRLILDRTSLDETCPPNQEAGYFYPDSRPSLIGSRVEKWRNALKDEQAPSVPARPNLATWIEQR